jgi:multidrug efflux pump subunit AcrA (membrane-fusion protein)
MTRNWTNWNEADAMKIMRLAGLLLVMTIILLDLSGCAPTEERSAPTELPRNVRVMDMAPADIDEFFEISGPVAPVRGSDISAEESGVVKAINNDKGAHVGEGDVLLELDRDLLRAEMQAAKSNFEHQSYNADKTRELFDAGKVSNPDLLLRSGVIGRARLPKVRHEGSLALPRDAVLTTDEGHAVFVIEGDRARKRKVQLGHDQGLMVLVTDGLEIGEKVVVRGHRELMDGSLVEITETAMLADGSVAGDPAEVTDAAARLRKWNAGEDD